MARSSRTGKCRTSGGSGQEGFITDEPEGCGGHLSGVGGSAAGAAAVPGFAAPLPAGTPARQRLVQGLRLGRGEVAAAGFLALGVQPEAAVVLFPEGHFLVAGPVVPRRPGPDQGSKPVLPSGLVGP